MPYFYHGGHLTKDLYGGVPDVLGGKWSPQQLTGIIAAYYISTIDVADGEAVSIYADQISSYDMTQTASNRPTYDINGLNNGPGLAFSLASTQYLKADDLASALFSGIDQPSTIAMSIQASSLASQMALFSVSGTGNKEHSLYTNATPQYYALRVDDASASVSKLGGTPDTAAHVIIFQFTGTTITLTVDGVLAIDNQSFNNGQLTVTEFSIGASRVFAGVFFPFDGVIGDILICNRSITPTERDNVLRWYSDRTAIPVWVGGVWYVG